MSPQSTLYCQTWTNRGDSCRTNSAFTPHPKPPQTSGGPARPRGFDSASCPGKKRARRVLDWWEPPGPKRARIPADTQTKGGNPQQPPRGVAKGVFLDTPYHDRSSPGLAEPGNAVYGTRDSHLGGGGPRPPAVVDHSPLGILNWSLESAWRLGASRNDYSGGLKQGHAFSSWLPVCHRCVFSPGFPKHFGGALKRRGRDRSSSLYPRERKKERARRHTGGTRREAGGFSVSVQGRGLQQRRPAHRSCQGVP